MDTGTVRLARAAKRCRNRMSLASCASGPHIVQTGVRGRLSSKPSMFSPAQWEQRYIGFVVACTKRTPTRRLATMKGVSWRCEASSWPPRRAPRCMSPLDSADRLLWAACRGHARRQALILYALSRQQLCLRNTRTVPRKS
jgi:hypothetical protein